MDIYQALSNVQSHHILINMFNSYKPTMILIYSYSHDGSVCMVYIDIYIYANKTGGNIDGFYVTMIMASWYTDPSWDWEESNPCKVVPPQL